MDSGIPIQLGDPAPEVLGDQLLKRAYLGG